MDELMFFNQPMTKEQVKMLSQELVKWDFCVLAGKIDILKATAIFYFNTEPHFDTKLISIL